MKYKYAIDEYDTETGRFVRSVNAYASEKRATAIAEAMTAEAQFTNDGHYYVVSEM